MSVLFSILGIAIIVFGTGISCRESANVGNTKFIRWMEFTATADAMNRAIKADIDSCEHDYPLCWIDALAYAAAKSGNKFTLASLKYIDDFADKISDGYSVEDITKDIRSYDYYRQAYGAVLNEFVGEYTLTDENGKTVKKYGLKAFCPIAECGTFSHYRDFGAGRSYGFRRRHLGNDLLGSVGTPIVAVESGTVEALGWNRYGGWRIGIRSFDKKRYYYYAHLKKNNPYAKGLKVGSKVTAGDHIGYLGMTGYSYKENVNNINIPHLHFGMQIIFDESQKDGNGEIWIDVYDIVNVLSENKSTLVRQDDGTYKRKYIFKDIENGGD